MIDDKKFGITNAGKKLQEEIDSLARFRKHPVQKEGDSIYENESLGIKVDLENKDGTMNQIRAIKNNIIINRNKTTGEIFVIPASEVIRIVSARRGQHTPDPFVCCGLGVLNSTRKNGDPHPIWSNYLVSGGIDGIEKAVIDAARYDNLPENKKLIEWSEKHREKIEILAEKAKNNVKLLMEVE